MSKHLRLNELELKVVKATENSLTPATKALLQEIALESLRNVKKCKQISDILFSNINYKNPDKKLDVTAYKTFQKTFELYDYLIKFGDKQIILTELILIKKYLQKWSKYSYIDPKTKIDMGRTIQFLSKKLLDMVVEQEKIENIHQTKHNNNNTSNNNSNNNNNNNINGNIKRKKKKKKKKKRKVETNLNDINNDDNSSVNTVPTPKSNFTEYKNMVKSKKNFNSLDDIFNTFDAEEQYNVNRNVTRSRYNKNNVNNESQFDVIKQKASKYKLGSDNESNNNDDYKNEGKNVTKNNGIHKAKTYHESYLIDDDDIVNQLNNMTTDIKCQDISDIDDGIESMDDENEVKQVNKQFKHQIIDQIKTEQLLRDTQQKRTEVTMNDDDLFNAYLEQRKTAKKSNGNTISEPKKSLTEQEYYNEIDNELKNEELSRFGRGVNSKNYQNHKRKVYGNVTQNEYNQMRGKFGTLSSNANKNMIIPELNTNNTIKGSHNNIFKIMAAESELPNYSFGGVNYGRTKTQTINKYNNTTHYDYNLIKKKQIVSVPTRYNDFNTQKIKQNNAKFKETNKKLNEIDFNFSTFEDNSIKINKSVIDPNDL